MRLVHVLYALLVVACTGGGGSPGDDASTSAESTVAASTSSDSATSLGGTSNASSGAVDGVDSSGSEQGDRCPAFEDEVAPGPITVEITNNLDNGVWVPLFADCIESVPHAITDPDGVRVPWRSPPCGTCEGAVQGLCPCPPPFCDEYHGLFLEPGAAVEYAWSGLRFEQEEVPPLCPGIAMCGETCERGVVPVDGTYTFTIQVGRAQGCAMEPCACTPMDGSCVLNDEAMTFTMLMDVSGTLDLPGESVVQLSID